MAWQVNLNRLLGEVMRGDVEGVMEGVGRVLGMAPDPHHGSNMTQAMIPGISQPRPVDAGKDCGTGTTVAPPPARGVQQPCCNRFALSDGFLVDGVTGRVWQFDKAKTVFDEVPVSNNHPKKDLVDAMVENRLSAIKAEYEQEMLATVSRQKRAGMLAQFEKDHLAPVRAAAQSVTY